MTSSRTSSRTSRIVRTGKNGQPLPDLVPLPLPISDVISLEIYDLIIDFLYSDLQALSTCALVCKAWLPASRLHLFCHLELAQLNFRRFLDLLKSPDFSAHVRARTNKMTMVQHTGSYKRWLQYCIPYLKDFSVKILDISGLAFAHNGNPPPYPELSGLQAHFQSVTQLHLRSTKLNSCMQLAELVCSLRNLERVSLLGVSWYPGAPSHPATGPVERLSLPPSLVELDIQSEHPSYLRDILNWLAEYDQESLPRIHTLVLVSQRQIPGPNDFGLSAERLLNNLGASLLNLTVSHFDFRNHEGDLHLLSLNTSLRTLHFYDVDVQRSINPELAVFHRRMYSWIPSMLAQIPSSDIRTVSFQVVLARAQHLDGLDWGALAAALSRPQFSQLARLEFKVSSFKKQAEKMIREKLLECTQRRILDIASFPNS
ncbi:hypothetical protein Hypma_013825 [Hypsizygus marmoreus]|uniref:F-box domain-containing protein n=1 Tax=Hypsizygus marmoreus TaxID=39966 RepID=A0A369KGF4_HYPMA|nr:hypothetical protein Hypma_013825 [Hypsizygus marmoreus]